MTVTAAAKARATGRHRPVQRGDTHDGQLPGSEGPPVSGTTPHYAHRQRGPGGHQVKCMYLYSLLYVTVAHVKRQSFIQSHICDKCGRGEVYVICCFACVCACVRACVCVCVGGWGVY